ncbi:MAG TPA: ABC transporter ATP-binding protein [Azospirillum sp.]|nr:ABC transporter ATP-binding protein [Azospirillum sp.]
MSALSFSAHDTSACLEVQGLSKSFGGFKAICDVGFTLRKGTITAIIGPNGAGKSTLFNLITGHYPPTSGRVVLDGRDITGIAPHRLGSLGLGRSFQRTNIFPRLTVFENVQAALIAHHGKGRRLFALAQSLFRQETAELLASVGLADRADRPAGTLAYGDQKQLELGIALALQPSLLLLDEPTAGMSSRETEHCIDLIRRIVRGRGITLLFTEHDLDVVFSISDRILVLQQGRLIADGAPEAVRCDEQVKRVYLGGHA